MSTDSATRSDREERMLQIIETARAKRPRFRDERITLAHGAGGKATQTLIEGLLVPAFAARRSRSLASWRTPPRSPWRRAAGDDDRQLRGQAAALPGRLDRRAGGQRHGQRPGDGRRSAAGADRSRDPRGGTRRRRCCEPRSRRSRTRPPRPGWRSSAATRRWLSAVPRTRCTSARPAIGVVDDRARNSRRRRSRPAIRSWCQVPSANTGPRSCSPATSSTSTPRSNRTRARCGRPPTRCWAQRVLSCTACATRRGAGWPRCSTSWPGRPGSR